MKLENDVSSDMSYFWYSDNALDMLINCQSIWKIAYIYSKISNLYCLITLSSYFIVQCDCEFNHRLRIKCYKITMTTTLKHCICCLKTLYTYRKRSTIYLLAMLNSLLHLYCKCNVVPLFVQLNGTKKASIVVLNVFAASCCINIFT